LSSGDFCWSDYSAVTLKTKPAKEMWPNGIFCRGASCARVSLAHKSTKHLPLINMEAVRATGIPRRRIEESGEVLVPA
jgi:hypothetical protein